MRDAELKISADMIPTEDVIIADRRVPSLLRRFRTDERGVSAIEFAFIAPFMLLLFLACLMSSISSQPKKGHDHGPNAVRYYLAGHNRRQRWRDQRVGRQSADFEAFSDYGRHHQPDRVRN